MALEGAVSRLDATARRADQVMVVAIAGRAASEQRAAGAITDALEPTRLLESRDRPVHRRDTDTRIAVARGDGKAIHGERAAHLRGGLER